MTISGMDLLTTRSRNKNVMDESGWVGKDAVAFMAKLNEAAVLSIEAAMSYLNLDLAKYCLYCCSIANEEKIIMCWWLCVWCRMELQVGLWCV